MPARPTGLLARLGPNWFTAVMGTGIVANAAALLPHQDAALHAGAVAVWLLAAGLLLTLLVATVVHCLQQPGRARAHALDPAMAPFFGAPPMALMTVGAGALLVGRDVVGLEAAVTVAAVLWVIGTVGGLASAGLIPYLMITRHAHELRDVSATWLLPIVPPMVSAATGAALVPHLPAGPARLGLVLGCYVLFGLSLAAAGVTAVLLWGRLVRHGVGPAAAVPTLWIVLGPLGQSITAANLLANVAPAAVPGPSGTALGAFGVLYGLPLLGAALTWLAGCVALTVRTARRGLPFTPAWWSFVFPVGTLVTGVSALARHAGSAALGWLAVALFALLVGTWAMVAARTLHRALATVRPRTRALPSAA